MMLSVFEVAIILVGSCFLYVFLRWTCYVCWKKAAIHSEPSQQTVWTVTGQMNRDGSADNQRWPTHDHRLSVDSFIVTENVRMQQKDRLPPPAYAEIDLPTYEQAICMTLPKNNVAAVHTASSSTTNLDRPS